MSLTWRSLWRIDFVLKIIAKDAGTCSVCQRQWWDWAWTHMLLKAWSWHAFKSNSESISCKWSSLADQVSPVLIPPQLCVKHQFCKTDNNSFILVFKKLLANYQKLHWSNWMFPSTFAASTIYPVPATLKHHEANLITEDMHNNMWWCHGHDLAA